MDPQKYSTGNTGGSVFFLDNLVGWITIGGRGFTTANGGEGWKELALPDNFAIQDTYWTDKSTGWIAGYSPATASRRSGTAALYKTSDGGTSWNNVYVPGSKTFFDCLSFADGRGLLISNDSLFISDPNSKDWREVLVLIGSDKDQMEITNTGDFSCPGG